MKEAPKKVSVSVYFDVAIVDIIKEVAKEEHRSVSNLIESVIMRYVLDKKE
jgi:hypothetical protein